MGNLTSPTDWTKLTNQYRLKKTPIRSTNKIDELDINPRRQTPTRFRSNRSTFDLDSNDIIQPKSPEQFKEYLLLQKAKRQDNEIAQLDLKNQDLQFKLYGKETEMRGLESGLEKAKHLTG